MSRKTSLSKTPQTVSKAVTGNNSDLLENSAELFPYRSTFAIREPDELAQRLEALGISASTSEAEVVVYGFGREHDGDRLPLEPETAARIRLFWNDFFRTGGAASVHIGQVLNLDSADQE